MHEVVEPVFAGDDDKMRDTASQPHPHDDGVSAGEVRIDQLIRSQVFVCVPDAFGREPCRAIPINPALLGAIRISKSAMMLSLSKRAPTFTRKPERAMIRFMSTRELIEKEIAALPEPLQRKVYDFAVLLRKKAREESFNGAELSESVLARDWNSPEQGAFA